MSSILDQPFEDFYKDKKRKTNSKFYRRVNGLWNSKHSGEQFTLRNFWKNYPTMDSFHSAMKDVYGQDTRSPATAFNRLVSKQLKMASGKGDADAETAFTTTFNNFKHNNKRRVGGGRKILRSVVMEDNAEIQVPPSEPVIVDKTGGEPDAILDKQAQFGGAAGQKEPVKMFEGRAGKFAEKALLNLAVKPALQSAFASVNDVFLSSMNRELTSDEKTRLGQAKTLAGYVHLAHLVLGPSTGSEALNIVIAALPAQEMTESLFVGGIALGEVTNSIGKAAFKTGLRFIDFIATGGGRFTGPTGAITSPDDPRFAMVTKNMSEEEITKLKTYMANAPPPNLISARVDDWYKLSEEEQLKTPFDTFQVEPVVGRGKNETKTKDSATAGNQKDEVNGDVSTTAKPDPSEESRPPQGTGVNHIEQTGTAAAAMHEEDDDHAKADQTIETKQSKDSATGTTEHNKVDEHNAEEDLHEDGKGSLDDLGPDPHETGHKFGEFRDPNKQIIRRKHRKELHDRLKELRANNDLTGHAKAYNELIAMLNQKPIKLKDFYYRLGKLRDEVAKGPVSQPDEDKEEVTGQTSTDTKEPADDAEGVETDGFTVKDFVPDEEPGKGEQGGQTATKTSEDKRGGSRTKTGTKTGEPDRFPPIPPGTQEESDDSDDDDTDMMLAKRKAKDKEEQKEDLHFRHLLPLQRDDLLVRPVGSVQKHKRDWLLFDFHERDNEFASIGSQMDDPFYKQRLREDAIRFKTPTNAMPLEFKGSNDGLVPGSHSLGGYGSQPRRPRFGDYMKRRFKRSRNGQLLLAKRSQLPYQRTRLDNAFMYSRRTEGDYVPMPHSGAMHDRTREHINWNKRDFIPISPIAPIDTSTVLQHEVHNQGDPLEEMNPLREKWDAYDTTCVQPWWKKFV